MSENVVRVKRWNRIDELHAPEVSEPITIDMQQTEDMQPTEDHLPRMFAEKSETTPTPIVLSFWGLAICGGMISIFILRGALGFAADWWKP